jgi:hypothetical protein
MAGAKFKEASELNKSASMSCHAHSLDGEPEFAGEARSVACAISFY